MNRIDNSGCYTFALLVFVLVSASGLPLWAVGVEGEGSLEVKPPLIALNTPEGRRLLAESKAQEAYWSLLQNYEPQQDKASCSVASCVIVLNALDVPRPEATSISPYRLFTPANLFNSDVTSITTQAQVSHSGMTLHQLHGVISKFDVTARQIYASESDEAAFRRALAETLAVGGGQVIANYYRPILSQEGDGHISPLAAYNQARDMVLVADTASYKYPWTWVPVSQLWNAMAKYVDPSSHKTRGYLIVSRKRQTTE